MRRLTLSFLAVLAGCSSWPPKRIVLGSPPLERKLANPKPARRPAAISRSNTLLPEDAVRALLHYHPDWRPQIETGLPILYTADLNGDGDRDYVLQGVSKGDGLVIALVTDGKPYSVVEMARLSPTSRRIFELRLPGEYHDPETGKDLKLSTATVYLRTPGRERGRSYYWAHDGVRSIAAD